MLIECKHAGKVPENELERSKYAWYLSHNGVIHGRKPENIEWCLTQAQDSKVLHLKVSR